MFKNKKYSLVNLILTGNFKTNDNLNKISKKIEKENIDVKSIDISNIELNVCKEYISKKNSKKLLELMELIVLFDSYLPTKSNHLHTNNLNHLEEIKSLRELVSNIKKSLRPNYKIISKLNNHNFVLHDSLLSCGMILGFLQSWDEHELLTPNQYKNLNILLVVFSRNMHDVLSEIKV